jgi:hypothetical protein
LILEVIAPLSSLFFSLHLDHIHHSRSIGLQGHVTNSLGLICTTNEQAIERALSSQKKKKKKNREQNDKKKYAFHTTWVQI